jgi:hypothetical protein
MKNMAKMWNTKIDIFSPKTNANFVYCCVCTFSPCTNFCLPVFFTKTRLSKRYVYCYSKTIFPSKKGAGAYKAYLCVSCISFCLHLYRDVIHDTCISSEMYVCRQSQLYSKIKLLKLNSSWWKIWQKCETLK